MGMRVTCAWCKTRVEKKNSVFKANDKYNTYYCCQEHMDEALKKKKEIQKEKEAIHVEKEKIKQEKEETKRKQEEEKKAREIARIAKKQEKEEAQKEKEKAKKAREEAKRIKEEQKAEKKQRKIDPVYEEVADIFGYRTQNSVLFAEMKLWRGICDDAKILAYLQEHKDFIKSKLEKLDNSEYSRIRYMSAILKNNLADYKKTVKVETEKINVDCEIYEPTVSTKRKRRGLNALEDEVI